MNRYQKRLYKKQSQAAAASYVAPADCIGKTFSFGSSLYHVLEYNADKFTFTCELVNSFNLRVEKDETFVRHHCTPVTPPVKTETPSLRSGEGRDGEPRYSSVVDLKIERRGAMDCAHVVSETPVDNNLSQPAPKSPEHYLDQQFSFQSGDSTFNVTVQLYNEKRDAFLLYDPNGCTGSFYREASFVYTHCQPAAEPVVRQSFPVIEIDKTRFLNLLSITHPLHPLNPLLKDGDS